MLASFPPVAGFALFGTPGSDDDWLLTLSEDRIRRQLGEEVSEVRPELLNNFSE